MIGMPFRMLLNESESMRQILMHRQSAQSMAGLRALHIVSKQKGHERKGREQTVNYSMRIMGIYLNEKADNKNN